MAPSTNMRSSIYYYVFVVFIPKLQDGWLFQDFWKIKKQRVWHQFKAKKKPKNPPTTTTNKQRFPCLRRFKMTRNIFSFLWTRSVETFKLREEEKRRVSARFSDGVLFSAAAPLCALGLIREMHSQVRILADDASGVCQVDTACIHLPPLPPRDESATSFSPWRDPPHRDLEGRFPLGLRPDGATSEVCRRTRPAASPGHCGSSGQTKPSDSSVAPPSPREYLSAPPPLAFLWNKWFSVADGWGTRAGCVGSCVIHRQSHNGFTPVVVVAAASCSVLATFVFRHFDFLFIYFFCIVVCVFSFPPYCLRLIFANECLFLRQANEMFSCVPLRLISPLMECLVRTNLNVQ